MKKAILATAAFSALCSGAPTAYAQSTATLGEVVVTAQRREESAQAASVAIQVLSPKQLEGVTEATQLNRLVPGAQISMAGSVVQAYIRGAGTPVSNGRDQGAVSFNLDGFNLARGTAISPNFFDLARVEVLKGPQGTLYGRNATAGAINIITNAPKLGEFSGNIGIEVGNYDLRRFSAALNIPINEQLAVRAAMQVVDRDGYFSDGTNDEKSRAGRIRALWKPNDDVSLLINLDASHQGGKGGGGTSVISPKFGVRTGTWDDGTCYAFAGPTCVATIRDVAMGVGLADPRYNPAAPQGVFFPDKPPYLDNDMWGASAELNWNLGFANLTVMPGYRHQDVGYRTHPGFVFDDVETNKQKSLEVRLGNQTGKLKWVAGVYYFKEDQDIFLLPDQGAQNFGRINLTQGTETRAVFAEGTYSVSEKLRLILGARYTSEDLTGNGSAVGSQGNPATGNVVQIPYNYPINVDLSDNATTWRTGVEYDLAANSMLFFTVARGYKGGGWYPSDDNLPGPGTGYLTFRPEYLTAYTLGSRNEFLHHTLRLNVEAFYWDYKDHQEAFIGVQNGKAGFYYANAEKAHIQGISVDTIWRATEHDTFRLSGEYLDAQYDRFKRDTIDLFVELPGPQGFASASDCKVTDPSPIPGNVATVDCGGHQMMRSPKWTANGGYEHTFDLGDGGQIVAGVNFQYIDDRWLSVNFTPGEHVGSVTTWDADITYVAPNDKWSVTAWGRNLTDEAQYSGGGTTSPIGLAPLPYIGSVGAPKTYGVRFQAKF